MTHDEADTDVLIVGAGPVGLCLGLDLAWRGVRCIAVDQGGDVTEHPRTGLISVRTMEFCRRWGITEEVRACGFPDDFPLNIVFCTSLSGHVLAQGDYPAMRDLPTPPQAPEHKQRCPQSWFDPILRRAVARLSPDALRFHTRFDGFEEDASGVTAGVTDLRTGAGERVRAAYLVGCDGAASRLREALGIGMTGNPALSYSVNVLLRLPDFLSWHDKGPAERYLFAGPDGVWANLTVVDGRETWRLTVLGNESRMDLERFDPAAAVRRAFGRDDVPFEVLSVIPWRRSQLLADRYRRGRVFLAGDAVHTMSPTGGMGANTGIGDAADLAWKLEAALRGWGGEGLLDSYEAERRPVARRAADFSTANFKAWIAPPRGSGLLDETPEGAALRAGMGEHLLEGTRVEWESLGLQLGYRYEGSPVIVPDGTAEPEDDLIRYVPTGRPGHLAPHAWLPDGRSTLDLFGRGFVLLDFGADAAPLARAAESRGVPLRVERIGDAGIAAAYGASLVLVRPDGHVAWRGEAAADPEAIIGRMCGWTR